MEGFQLVQSDHPVKLRQYAVQVIYNIIAAVMDMAAIQANAYLVAAHAINNGLQLLKLANRGLDPLIYVNLECDDGMYNNELGGKSKE